MKLEFQCNVLDDVHGGIRFCIVTLKVCIVMDQNGEWCIFPILPVSIPRSYSKNACILTDFHLEFILLLLLASTLSYTVSQAFLQVSENHVCR